MQHHLVELEASLLRVLKAGETINIGQIHFADRSVSLLSDDDFGLPSSFTKTVAVRRAFTSIIDLVAVNK
jgi:hypothetical protein